MTFHVDRADRDAQDQAKTTLDLHWYDEATGKRGHGLPPAHVLHGMILGGWYHLEPRLALRAFRETPTYKLHREKLDPLLVDFPV